MKKVETWLNEREYAEFCKKADQEGKTPYGLFKLLVLAEISTGDYECCICKKKTSHPIVHHISYNPEVTILICRPCHGWLHSADYSNGQKRAWELKKQGARARKIS